MFFLYSFMKLTLVGDEVYKQNDEYVIHKIEQYGPLHVHRKSSHSK